MLVLPTSKYLANNGFLCSSQQYSMALCTCVDHMFLLIVVTSHATEKMCCNNQIPDLSLYNWNIITPNASVY